MKKVSGVSNDTREKDIDFLDEGDDEITYTTSVRAYTAYSDDDDDDDDDHRDLNDLLCDKPTTKYSDNPNPGPAATKSNQQVSPTNITSKCNADESDEDESEDDDEYDEDGGLLEPFQARSSVNIGHDTDRDSRHRGGGAERNYEEEEEDDSLLRPGDHIFVWKSSGMFGMKTFQKHGIVLSLDQNDESNISIVTFYHKNEKYYEPERRGSLFQRKNVNEEEEDSWEPYRNEDETDASLLNKDSASEQENAGHGSRIASSRAKQNQKFTPTVRVESLFSFTANSKGGVQKVKYRASLAKRLLSRGGTVTCCSPDEQTLVLARVKYLLEAPGRLPEFHLMAANGECAAVWCRMGRWCTLQGSSILHILFVGQAGGAAVGGVVASNVMLWAPMPGFWGSVGYIWFVPATVAYPLLVPLLIGFGLASLVPLEALRRFRKKWAEISIEMNTAFWVNTDVEVRECYYASTMSSDDDWMKKFFGDSPVGGAIKKRDGEEDKAEEERGQYMPLGGQDNFETSTKVNGIPSFEASANMDEDEMMKQVNAEYGITDSKLSQQEFEQEWKFGDMGDDQTSKTENIKWNTMSFGSGGGGVGGDGGVGSTFTGGKKQNNKSIFDDETKRPLTDDDTSCKEIL